MISFFKDKSPVSVFLLLFLIIALHANSLMHPVNLVAAKQDGYLWYFIAPFKNVPQALPFMLGIFIFITALLVNYVFNALRLFIRSGYTGALAYVLLSAILPQWNNIFTGLIAQLLLLWSFYFMCRLYNASNPKPLIFNTGFLAGTLLILYFSSFPIIILLFIALAITRPFRLNEWFILLLGILTPLYFFAGFLFLNDLLKTEAVFFIGNFKPHIISPENIIATTITLGVTSLFVLSGLISERNSSNYASLQVRKSWALIFWMFLLFTPVIFLMKENWINTLFLLVLPASAYIGYIFSNAKIKIIPIIIFWSLIALVVYNNWFVK